MPLSRDERHQLFDLDVDTLYHTQVVEATRSPETGRYTVSLLRRVLPAKGTAARGASPPLSDDGPASLVLGDVDTVVVAVGLEREPALAAHLREYG